MSSGDSPQWFAVYTRPRNEKKVEGRLSKSGVETCLPLKKVLRRWSDRQKKVEVPLMPSYLFVCITDEEKNRVLEDEGVVRFVAYQGKPAVIRKSEITAMLAFLEMTEGYSVWIEQDKEVEITEGPLKGATGRVERIGKDKVRLRIEQLRLVLHAEIDRSSVKPLKKV